MAFTVEDGTGLTTSNAYISVADADAYFSDRGRSDWTGTDAVKQAAIVRATDYIDHTFTFKGVRVKNEQALEWPRQLVYDDLGDEIEELPTRLVHACAEYARLALTIELAAEPDGNPDGTVSLKREKVGPIEEETQYTNGASNRLARYPVADGMLRPLLASSNFLLRA